MDWLTYRSGLLWMCMERTKVTDRLERNSTVTTSIYIALPRNIASSINTQEVGRTCWETRGAAPRLRQPSGFPMTQVECSPHFLYVDEAILHRNKLNN